MRTILPLYQAITTVAIGDGRQTSFWLDVWLGDDALADRFPALYSHCTKKEASVQVIVDSNISSTLVNRLSTVALSQLHSLQDLLAHVNLTSQPDKRMSPFIDPTGKLDTASVYRLLKARGQTTNDQAKFIWNSRAPPRVQFFMWLLCHNRIQCRTNLLKKRIVSDAICEICSEAEETAEHIIFHCNIARNFWAAMGITVLPGQKVEDIHTIPCPPGIHQQGFETMMALACWQLWKRRNAVIFRDERASPNQLLSSCKSEAEQWRVRMPKKQKNVGRSMVLAIPNGNGSRLLSYTRP